MIHHGKCRCASCDPVRFFRNDLSRYLRFFEARSDRPRDTRKPA